jgi:hypothetical protein
MKVIPESILSVPDEGYCVYNISILSVPDEGYSRIYFKRT